MLYKTLETGEKVPITNKEMNAFIKKVNNWDKRTYEKQYDIFRNKLKNYERFTGREKQSTLEVLYKMAVNKSKGRELSEEMKLIISTPSVSSGKAGAKYFAVGSKTRAAYEKKYQKVTDEAFAEFIKEVPKAAEIVEKIKDPVMQRKALEDLAKEMHAKFDEYNKYVGGSAIPFATKPFDYSAVEDFDVEAYLLDSNDT